MGYCNMPDIANTMQDSRNYVSVHSAEHSSPNHVRTTTSIRQIRASIVKLSTEQTQHMKIDTKPAKRKTVLFGGLFQKEPSMAALEQYASTVETQRDSGVAKKVPFISSRKMPEHVPKVNSRWDGVPDQVRQNEKRTRRTHRASMITPSLNGLRINDTDSSSSERRRNSVAESWDSRASSLRLSYRDTSRERADSICSYVSVGTGQDARLTAAQPHAPQAPSTPVGLDSIYPVTQQTPSAVQTPTPTAGTVQMMTSFVFPRPIDPVPEHSISPLSSPVETSPKTPQSHEQISWQKAHSLTQSSPSKTITADVNAFLAGEARPLELISEADTPSKQRSNQLRKVPASGGPRHHVDNRPDSSGILVNSKARAALSADVAPWETFDAIPQRHRMVPKSNILRRFVR